VESVDRPFLLAVSGGFVSEDTVSEDVGIEPGGKLGVFSGFMLLSGKCEGPISDIASPLA